MRGRVYLLDTHARIFYLENPETLPPGLLQVLEEARGREALLVSAITPGEVAALARPEQALEAPGIRVVPLEAAYLDLPHPDPADRFITATALWTGAVLATRDERLRAYPKVDAIRDWAQKEVNPQGQRPLVHPGKAACGVY